MLTGKGGGHAVSSQMRGQAEHVPVSDLHCLRSTGIPGLYKCTVTVVQLSLIYVLMSAKGCSFKISNLLPSIEKTKYLSMYVTYLVFNWKGVLDPGGLLHRLLILQLLLPLLYFLLLLTLHGCHAV